MQLFIYFFKISHNFRKFIKVHFNYMTFIFLFISIKIIDFSSYFYFFRFIQITSIILSINNLWFMIPLMLQLLVYIMAILKVVFQMNNKLFNFCSYYCMTVFAQLIGVLKTITRKNKPFWEKAESTR